MYPKFGPGQMWEEVGKIILKKGGEIHFSHEVVGIECNTDKLIKVEVQNCTTGKLINFEGDYFFSTMAVKDLINSYRSNNPLDS
jgi:L-2-hydroxyglutarate oxidase LhgO